MVQINDFIQRCHGQYTGPTDLLIQGFSLDSRTVRPGELFIAVNGNHVDGNQYAQQALEKGAIAVLSESPGAGPRIQVSSIPDSLALFGESCRKEFTGPVIGITGSNGKTSTKEFLSAALSCQGSVLKNIGNQNTEYTSPLVWSRKTKDDWAAVIEMSMRGFGQIKHLAEIAQPQIGIITLIGTAHSECVHSREGICKAKGELLDALPKDGTAILWCEDLFLQDLKKRSPCKVLTFGWSEQSDCRLLGYKPLSWEKSLIQASFQGEIFEAEIPILGKHQALNAAAAIVAAVTAGVSIQEAAKALSKATFPPLRMEIRSYHSATVLLDTYNAAPESVEAALESLAEMPMKGDRYVVLGEMRELGECSESAHRLVGTALTKCAPKHTFLYGEQTKFIYDEAVLTGYHPSNMTYVETIEEIRHHLRQLQTGDVVLMKASRAIGLEKVLESE